MSKSKKTGNIFRVIPLLQKEDDSHKIELASVSPHGGVLFRKWLKIFQEDLIGGLTYQNIKVKITSKRWTFEKNGTRDYFMIAEVHLPKNIAEDARDLVKSYIDSVDDDGNYPIIYKHKTYLASAKINVM